MDDELALHADLLVDEERIHVRALVAAELEQAEAKVAQLSARLRRLQQPAPALSIGRNEIRIWMDGAFDMFHYGHANAFRQGRSLGTYLVVGVNDDASITECKGPPVLNDDERIRMVSGCKFVDVCSCFGNTTLALVNGMTVVEIKANWADSDACKQMAKPRRFPATVTGIDLSANAVAYGKSAGIFDVAIQCDLNKWGAEQKAEIGAIMAEQDVLCATAALVYLDLETCDYLFGKFAEKKAPGRVIVNFLNPFELEKADATKRLLLKHFDFVGSRATKHRRLSSFEQSNYGGEVL